MRALFARIVLAALIVGLLTACAGLPGTSMVSAGEPIGAAAERDPLTVQPDGPGRSDSASQIATGFLRAHVDDTGGFGIAKEFLTPAAARSWQPSETVSIFPGDGDIAAEPVDATHVRVTARRIATLHPDGHLETLATPKEEQLTFRVAATPNGPRIAQLPQNLTRWLAHDDLTRLYSRLNVYLSAATGPTLVADPRWLPRRGLTTALARAVLSPPPAWLAPVVRDPFPAGTALDVDAVPTDTAGIASVDLSGSALRASAADRKSMWATLSASLLQAPSVNGVRVTVGGNDLDASGVSSPVRFANDTGAGVPSVNDAVIARAGTYLQWVRASAPDTLSEPALPTDSAHAALPAVPSEWRFLAAGREGLTLAGLNADRTQVRFWHADAAQTVSDLGRELSAPNVDHFGWVLVAGVPKDGGAERALWTFDGSRAGEDDAAASVDIAALPKGKIRAVRVSPEGSRMAFVLADGDKTRLFVASLTRDVKGRPTKLAAVIDVPINAPSMSDVTWADASSLAVLTSPGKGQKSQVFLAPIDGGALLLDEGERATSLTSSMRGADGLFLRRDDGTVLTRLGAGWNMFLTRGEVIVPAQ